MSGSYEKRFSQACENNRQPIIEQLTRIFADCTSVLEIGAGTGQHAAYFAPRLPRVLWQPTDIPDNHASIVAWSQVAGVTNIAPPKTFTVGLHDWPQGEFDGVFTANTAHIMQPQEVQTMMAMVSEHLPAGGLFCQYGPFLVDGDYTSPSNAEFDGYLRQQGCGGMCDIDMLAQWGNGLKLQERVAMPANNFLLVWRR